MSINGTSRRKLTKVAARFGVTSFLHRTQVMSAEDTEAFLMKINRQLGRGSEFRFVSWSFCGTEKPPPKISNKISDEAGWART